MNRYSCQLMRYLSNSVFSSSLVRLLPSLLVCWLGLAISVVAQDQPQAANVTDLAKQAEAFLKTHCYRCHGEAGTAEGGLNDIMDRNRLMHTGLIDIKEAKKSVLWKRVRDGEMPADDVTIPTEAEIQLLQDWIAAGAPDFRMTEPPREFMGVDQIQQLIVKDLETFAPRVALRKRYITLTHLYNQNRSEAELSSYRHALAKLLNSVSWGQQILPLEPIDPAQTIFRIDLRDLQWSNTVWNKIVARYPYAEEPEGVDGQIGLQKARSRAFMIRGDWFVAMASRPPLYHEILEIPQTDRELEQRIGVNVARNYFDENYLRAGFNRSGVSQNNRLIERHDSPFGGYWKSFDFASNADSQNLFANPQGPGVGERLFKHDGGEIIFSLPNGLQGYMLADHLGNRIDKGPTAIVSDPSRPDRAVENGISCMGCHARGMIRKDDQILAHVSKNPKSFSDGERFYVNSIYRPGDMQAAIDRDAARFEAAVKACGVPFSKTEPVLTLAKHYEEELDLTAVAAEVGMPSEAFRRMVNENSTLARFMGPVLVDGGTIQREVIEKSFAELVRAAGRQPLFRDHTNFEAETLGNNYGIRDNAMLFSKAAFYDTPNLDSLHERRLNIVIETIPEPPAELLDQWTQADADAQYQLAVQVARQRFIDLKPTFVLLLIDSRIFGPKRVFFGDSQNYSSEQRVKVIEEMDKLILKREFDQALQSFLRQVNELPSPQEKVPEKNSVDKN